LAHYTALWPNTPYPWIGWAFWQHSDKGTLPGIKTHVDLNWYTGSEAELIEQFVSKGNAINNRNKPEQNTPIQEIPESKSFIDTNIKGDYQEESQDPDFIPLQFNKTKSAEAKYSSQEENWIRSYFFNN
jgi:hypothetical protein